MKDLLKIYNICTCMVGSIIEAHLFGSMKEDEECDYDHTLIDDSSAQSGDKENCMGRSLHCQVEYHVWTKFATPILHAINNFTIYDIFSTYT